MYRAGVFGAWYRADDGFAIIRRFLGRSSGMAVRMRIGSFVLRIVVMRSGARPREHKLVASRRLHDEVNRGLTRKWSPEQISARLVVAHPDDPEMRVSHETIYQTLYLQARGELRTELKLALRQGRAKRVNRSRASCSKGKIRDMVNISERPAEAEDRAVPGFWEGDLIIGKANASQVATLVERTTRFTMLVRIPYDRNADRVARLLAMKMEKLPEFIRNSVTWDQGKEMARHKDFAIATGIDVYLSLIHI